MVNDFAVTLQRIDGENKEQLTERITHEIIRALFIHRIQNNKPCIIFVEGKSGEGKTVFSIRLIEILQYLGELINEAIDIDRQYIYTPFEYPEKMRWILTAPEAKNKHILVMGEARELVKSKTWFSVINQSVADVNAMSRSLKPLIFIVISQSIKDIDKDIRNTIDFRITCNRPSGQNTRIRISRVFMTNNIENPKLRQRRISGTVILDGKAQKIILGKLRVKLPDKKLMDAIEGLDREHKLKIILKKLDTMSRALQKELPRLTKLENLVEAVARTPASLNLIVRRGKGGIIKVKPEIKDMYQLSEQEFREFEKMLRARLIQLGVMQDDTTATTANE